MCELPTNHNILREPISLVIVLLFSYKASCRTSNNKLKYNFVKTPRKFIIIIFIRPNKIKCWFQVSGRPVENTTDHKHFIDIFFLVFLHFYDFTQRTEE